MALTEDDVRAAGGVVHRDGNIFFTNIDKLNSAVAPLLARIAEREAQVVSNETEHLWDGTPKDSLPWKISTKDY